MINESHEKVEKSDGESEISENLVDLKGSGVIEQCVSGLPLGPATPTGP